MTKAALFIMYYARDEKIMENTIFNPRIVDPPVSSMCIFKIFNFNQWTRGVYTLHGIMRVSLKR